jgi:hypothetical protein
MLEHMIALCRQLANFAEHPMIQSTAKAILEDLAPEPVVEVVENIAQDLEPAIAAIAEPVAPAPEPEPVPAPAPEAVDPRDAELETLRAMVASLADKLDEATAALSTLRGSVAVSQIVPPEVVETAPSDPPVTVSQ